MITKPVWGVESVVVSGGGWCVSNASMRVCVCAPMCVLGGAGKWGNHRIDEGSLHTEHMQGNVLAYNKPG